MPTVALTVSYNGAPFSGFARQPGGLLTVQGELEHALELLYRRPVPTVCAGRTDAGVHARGQVVSFPITREEAESRNLFKLKRSFQALTDDDISIQTLALMPPDFSARFSALEREYRYLIMPGDRHPLFLQDWCWDARRELDVDAMNEAAFAKRWPGFMIPVDTAFEGIDISTLSMSKKKSTELPKLSDLIDLEKAAPVAVGVGIGSFALLVGLLILLLTRKKRR